MKKLLFLVVLITAMADLKAGTDSDLVWTQPLVTNVVKFTPDGKHIVAAGDSLWLLDAATGAIERTYKSNTGFYSMDVSPDGKYIASSGAYTNVLLWDLKSGELVHTFYDLHEDVGGPSSFTAISFSPDGKYLVGSSVSDTVENLIIWNLNYYSVIKSIKFSGGFTHLTYSPSGNYFASSKGNRVYIWDSNFQPFLLDASSLKSIKSLAFSKTNDLLAVGNENGTTKIFDCNTKKLIKTYTNKKDTSDGISGIPPTESLAFSSDSKFIIIGKSAIGYNIDIIDINTDNIVKQYLPKKQIQTIDVSQNDDFFVVQGVRLYKLDLFSDITENLSKNITVLQVIPNPIKNSIKINFNLSQNGYTTLLVYDEAGNLKESLFKDLLMSGEHSMQFPLNNYSNGPYYLIIKCNNFSNSIKFIINR